MSTSDSGLSAAPPQPMTTALTQANRVTTVMQQANGDKRQRADDSSGRPFKRQRVRLQQGISGHAIETTPHSPPRRQRQMLHQGIRGLELETTLSVSSDASRMLAKHSKQPRPGWIVRTGEARRTNRRHVWGGSAHCLEGGGWEVACGPRRGSPTVARCQEA